MSEETRDQRVRFESPVRYRRIADPEWHFGSTIDVSGSGLLFLCDTPLEVGTEVEVFLPAMAQQVGSIFLLNLVYAGRVVRRVSAQWPDGRPAIAVEVSHCHISSCQDYRCSDQGGRPHTESTR